MLTMKNIAIIIFSKMLYKTLIDKLMHVSYKGKIYLLHKFKTSILFKHVAKRFPIYITILSLKIDV